MDAAVCCCRPIAKLFENYTKTSLAAHCQLAIEILIKVALKYDYLQATSSEFSDGRALAKLE